MRGLFHRRGLGTGCFLIGWLFFLGTSGLWAFPAEKIEKDITQKKNDLKDIKKELSLTKKKEKKIKRKETTILGTLRLLEEELDDKEKGLKQTEAQLAQTRERLHQTEQQVAVLSQGMGRTQEELFSRLVALYKMKRKPTEGLLLTSQSYPDLLRLDKYLKVIIDYDARLVDTYRNQVALKEQYQRELVRDQLRCQQHISEIEEKKREVVKVSEEKRALLKSIQDQKVVYQRVIVELEGRARELSTFIQKLEQEKKQFAYKESKKESFKGRLIPPVQGKVISLFKEKGQNGIEIKAPVGTEIRSVLPGKVLYADGFKGFGNIIVIDHGNHLFTVSGYCSELFKNPGDTVSQGERIALVGSAGSLKGPCLYFEIRQNGKPQDPLEWLSHLDRNISSPEETR